MKILIAGIVLALVALLGLIVTVALRLKTSSDSRKTGTGPGSGFKLAVTACGLISGAALLLSIIIIIASGSGTGRQAWNPAMEANPFFDLQKTADRPALSPGKVIRETTVTVSDVDQQVDLGPVAVTIPPGTLDKPETASAREAPREIPPPFGPAAGSLAFVDIRIGEMTRFAKPLTLQFPLKTVAIDPERPPEQQFYVAYFDETDLSWKRLPFTIDAETKTISVSTDHLTVYWIGNLFSYNGRRCTVYFLPTEMRSVNRKYESETGITSQDRLPLSIIRDMAFFVDSAYDSYQLPANPLPVPGYKVDVLAFLGSNASWFEKKTGKSETYTSTWTGAINVNCDAIRTSTDMMEVLRNDCAHELFHLIQREKYGISGMDLYNFSQSYFWLDAAAEYAASTLAWRTSATRHGRELGPTRANEADIGFLKETLVSNQDPHRYQAARFIGYLMESYRLKAAALLDIPQLDSTFSISFNQYVSAIYPDLTLVGAYDGFARHFTFDAASSCAPGSGGIYLEVKKYFSAKLLQFKDALGNVSRPVMEMDQELAAGDKYTADLTCYRPDLPCTVTLSLQQDNRYVSAGVFTRESAKPEKVETVFRDNPATFSLAAGETLVLLFTPLSAPQAVQVHIRAQRPEESLPAKPEPPDTAATASFTVRVLDAQTGNALAARVAVAPQDGGRPITKNGANIVFDGLAKGRYTVSVTARGYKPRSGDFSIDPDKFRENQSVCKLEREQESAASATASPSPAAKTTDPRSFDSMLKQRYDELYQLCDEIRKIWNKLQNCCSNQAHSGPLPDGMSAFMSVQKFGQPWLSCRNCGMKFSTMASKRPNGKTYYEHYRERVEYYDKLLQQAPPGFWKTHEYEEYGGLNIIKKK
jgi:hypothetical protein